MATFMNYEDEGGGGSGGGGDDTSSITICGSSSSTINSHCFNTHQTQSPTTIASPTPPSSSPHETTIATASSSCNTNGSTANTQNNNKTVANKRLNAGGRGGDDDENYDQLGCGPSNDCNNAGNTANTGLVLSSASSQQQQHQQPEILAKNLLLCRRFKDSSDSLRNFTSLPLFIYATSPSTHATSADGVGVAHVAVKAAEEAVANMKKNETHDLVRRNSNSASQQQKYHQQTGKTNPNSSSGNSSDGPLILRRTMDCLPLTHGVAPLHPHLMASSNTVNVTVAPPSALVTAYPHHHHLNINHHHLLSHHLPYSNNYASGLHHTTATAMNNHHHAPQHPHLNIHSEQTKSLQELQHEVGALLEFRDLVIETFPDLKQKMASISSATSNSSSTIGSTSGGGGGGGGSGASGNVQSSASVSGSGSNIPLSGGGTLVSRREWEPGIRVKRKPSQKEQPAAIELTSSSSLTRSRSNSHSGKKELKSSSGGGATGTAASGGESNNNGSVVQDSGFSTETSSSKEGHSASSTNGALTGAIASNRLSCPESDDELLNLLDVIHRKSNRLREEVEHLQNYERQHLQTVPRAANEQDQTDVATASNNVAEGGIALLKSSSSSSANTALTPKTFREHVERLNKEDLQQLRKERDRLLDKLAEMEAETLTGRIKAAKMSEQVEELINVKRDLEEQLKLAMQQRLELNARVQQLQQQQQQSKTSISQSDFSSSPRTFLSSSATTVLSTVSANSSRQNTFQPVVVEQQTQNAATSATVEQPQNYLIPFHQSIGSDNKRITHQEAIFSPPDQLGRLDGIVSTPGDRSAKCKVTDSKRFAAILLETSVIELRRHLLTLTVKNQVLMQKLEQASKTKGHLVKRLDKSKEDVEDLRFQLEEKNIELEGTKAQLRVLETRLHSITPSSGAATNSYLHSQNDYETNRSSASTTLMLSRRGGSGAVNTDSSDIRSPTPMSSSSNTPNGQMPQPITMQISTPSMKAMTHLPMDDMQHHSSSTESAHEHDVSHHPVHDAMVASQIQKKLENGRDVRQLLMSTSVGGVSPFEQQLQQQQVAAIRNHVQALKKFSGVTTTKPSKIPLPGSKAAAYFAGKPPSGRPSTAGRSPPSANSSGSSSRSPLSRSTGNLLYSKSPNSLKRADSAQSIRKDNNNSSSLSTNNSRSSTSSSIPMATTPYGSASKSYGGGVGASSAHMNTSNSPSSRILQNSPLPKPKRESLSTKVRHMDSLSRAYHQQQNNYTNISSASDNTPSTIGQTITTPSKVTASAPGGGNGAGSYLVSSTPKPSTIAAQLTSSLRKDLQLSSSSFNHTTAFQRRSAASSALQNTSSANINANRRLSSASIAGTRGNNRQPSSQDSDGQHNSNVSGNSVNAAAVLSTSSSHSGSGGHNGGVASDSDSGKNFSYDKNCANNIKAMKSGLNQYYEEVLPSSATKCAATDNKQHLNVLRTNSFNRKVTLSQYFEKELLEETSAEERLQKLNENADSMYETNNDDNNNEDEEIDIYTSYASYMSSSDPGSDNLLVTFDYGFQDSLADDFSLNSQELDPLEDHCASDKSLDKSLFKIPEEESTDHLLLAIKGQEMISKSPNIFKVHRVLHSDMKKIQSSSKQILGSTCTSLASSLVEYNIDTSGDYGSWAQESESEGDDDTEKSKHNYRYEDLIKNEVLIFDDNDDDQCYNDAHNVVNTSEVLIKFNFDEDSPPPRWFDQTLNQNFNTITCNHDNQPLYYRSVDYLN